MGYWGKIIGGMAGFAVGGPVGAMVGAALGHAADAGTTPNFPGSFRPMFGFNPARMAAMTGGRDHLFSMAVVVLCAKLAKCDGPVTRAEIDTFKRQFRIPTESVRDIGRLFDQARDSPGGFETYATQLGQAFADKPEVLHQVMHALFAVAQADGPVNMREQAFLRQVHHHFGLDEVAWKQARGEMPRTPVGDNLPDPYRVLGVTKTAPTDELRAAWKQLMRENHPDSLAARGVPEAMLKRASDKVASINAAWDRIKRERGL
jgi:DnaJ like chaperone protein